MAKTRLELLQELSDEMGDLVTGQVASGTATSFVSALDVDGYGELPSAGTDSTKFEKAWVYIYDGPHAGIERLIKDYTPSTRTFTVYDALGDAFDADDKFEIHTKASRREKVNALNKVLTQHVWRKCEQPLTLVPDGDMEDASTTSWTATRCTITKEATDGTFVWSGTRALKLVSTSADAWVETVSLPVNPGDLYLCQVHVLGATAGSRLTLQPRDQTAGVLIPPQSGEPVIETSTDGGSWHRLWCTFEIPDGCMSLRIRLREAEDAKTSYWDDLVLVNLRRNEYPLPSWITGEEHFEWVWIHPQRQPFQGRPGPVRNCAIFFDPARTKGQSVVVSEDGIGKVLTVSGRRFYDPLTNDSDSTMAPARWVKAATKVEIYRRLIQSLPVPDRTPYGQDLVDAQRELGAVLRIERPADWYKPMRMGLRAE